MLLVLISTFLLGLKPYDLVGVCPVPSAGRSWSVVWHFGPEGVEEADVPRAVRVQKYLESDAVGRCLAKLIETDPKASAGAARLSTSKTPAELAEAYAPIHRRWTAFGVDAVFLDVMESGQAAQRVGPFLERCERLIATSP